MKKNVTRIFLMAGMAFILSALLGGCYNLGEDLRGDLEGTIKLRNTEKTIGNVEITVESLWDSSYFVIYSDDEGYFSLDDVHFGVNKIVFTKKNYYVLTRYADIRADDTFLLNVEMKEYSPAISIFTLIEVIDSTTSMPVENAIVDVYVRRDDIFWDFYSSKYTDVEGKAIFFVGSLTRKGTIDVEARISAQGYLNGIFNFTTYYQKHQPGQVFYLTPSDY